MQYLLASIDEHRDSIPCSNNDIRSILRDVRPRRSKWISDDRINQEELYDAIEHVLEQLKNYRVSVCIIIIIIYIYIGILI
jgi:transcriptional activator SPT7